MKCLVLLIALIALLSCGSDSNLITPDPSMDMGQPAERNEPPVVENPIVEPLEVIGEPPPVQMLVPPELPDVIVEMLNEDPPEVQDVIVEMLNEDPPEVPEIIVEILNEDPPEVPEIIVEIQQNDDPPVIIVIEPPEIIVEPPNDDPPPDQ